LSASVADRASEQVALVTGAAQGLGRAFARGLQQAGAGEEVTSTWMKPEAICDVVLELLAEGPKGRSGHNVGCWVGRPIRLEDSIEAGHRR
jgi:NAD(P)-dependent dehydrogenase (short-subunit alcohol dehydrogenase family)